MSVAGWECWEVNAVLFPVQSKAAGREILGGSPHIKCLNLFLLIFNPEGDDEQGKKVCVCVSLGVCTYLFKTYSTSEVGYLGQGDEKKWDNEVKGIQNVCLVI